MNTPITLPISGYIVQMADYLTRRKAKEYTDILYRGVVAIPGQKPEIPMENTDPANDFMIAASIESVTRVKREGETEESGTLMPWGEMTKEARIDFVNDLPFSEYLILLSEAANRMNMDAAQKKS